MKLLKIIFIKKYTKRIEYFVKFLGLSTKPAEELLKLKINENNLANKDWLIVTKNVNWISWVTRFSSNTGSKTT